VRELKPKKPWHGYSRGYWTDEFEDEARLAVKGDYFQTEEKLDRQRVKLAEKENRPICEIKR
jgi:hypothetical protein